MTCLSTFDTTCRPFVTVPSGVSPPGCRAVSPLPPSTHEGDNCISHLILSISSSNRHRQRALSLSQPIHNPSRGALTPAHTHSSPLPPSQPPTPPSPETSLPNMVRHRLPDNHVQLTTVSSSSSTLTDTIPRLALWRTRRSSSPRYVPGRRRRKGVLGAIGRRPRIRAPHWQRVADNDSLDPGRAPREHVRLRLLRVGSRRYWREHARLCHVRAGARRPRRAGWW